MCVCVCACACVGGPQARGGRHAAGEGVLGGQPHHGGHARGHVHVHEEGGRGQPGPREHLRDDRGERSRPRGATLPRVSLFLSPSSSSSSLLPPPPLQMCRYLTARCDVKLVLTRPENLAACDVTSGLRWILKEPVTSQMGVGLPYGWTRSVATSVKISSVKVFFSDRSTSTPDG